MKKTKNVFAFDFRINEQETISLSLPEKFEDIFNTMSENTDSYNSIRELCYFVDEYSELSDADRDKFQEIIDSGLITWKLNSIHDLRILVWTLGDFEVIENAKNLSELGIRLLHLENFNKSENVDHDFKKAGLVFYKQTKGEFHENGNYYYINKIKSL